MRNSKAFWAAAFFLSLALPEKGSKEPLWKVTLPGESAGSPSVYAREAIVATKNGLLGAWDRSGRAAWKQKLPAGCLAAPAVDRNGDIYVACADGSLLRFSSTGKQIWQCGLKQGLLATPLLADTVLFTVSESGRVSRISKKEGAILKQTDLNLPVHSSPVWSAGRRHLLVPTKDCFLVALSQELRVLWKFKTTGVILSSPAVTPRDEVYLTSMDHHLYKLDPAGRPIWKFKARGWIKASPVIDENGRAYVGSYGRRFNAIGADGKPLWRFHSTASFTASAAIDEAGTIYCGDTSGTVYALGRGGKLSWKYKSADFITSDLTILPDKILLAGSVDGTLLAFQIGQPMSRKAWWAKYLGNLSNSGFDE